MRQTTYMHKSAAVERQWHLVDATNRILGQVATEIAVKLIGKGKKEYTPHLDIGDYVVVINAAKVAVTGRKELAKTYFTHSGIPGGLRKRSLSELRSQDPTQIIIHAVNNMLPKNKLRADRLKRLKVYVDEQHAHGAQLQEITKG